MTKSFDLGIRVSIIRLVSRTPLGIEKKFQICFFFSTNLRVTLNPKYARTYYELVE